MPKAKSNPSPAPEPELTVITTRLFASDVRILREQADESGIPWQLRLRLLVRAALRANGTAGRIE